MTIETYDWMIFQNIILLSMVVVLVFLTLRERRKAKSYTEALEQASDFTGNGLIFFDRKDRLISANAHAYEFLPDLEHFNEVVPKRHGVTLQDVLNYFYDHAVECDQGLLNTLDRSAGKLRSIGFREVIMTPNNRLCLIEAQKISNVGTNVILVDVGESKSQEDTVLRLSQYNHELHQAIQVATNGIIITKPIEDSTNQKVTFVNDAFCNIFGTPHERMIGTNITDVNALIEDKDTVKEIERVALSGKSGTVEVRMRNKELGERWYDLKLTPLMDSKGDLELLVGIMSDTTELKISGAESLKAQKLEALGQLAAGVAHDFNNVLSIIDGYARSTSKHLDDHERATENLKRVRTAAKRGTNLIKQMLTFSRHEIVDLSVVELGHMVREQETLLQPLIGASIKLKFLSDHKEMFVECPAENITQILMNLVINARDAMPQGGVLLVENRICPKETLPKALRSKDEVLEYASILVSDTGTGMPQDVIERIFDPFFTTKDQGKGTGLGLSMVYGLVQQIGGHIDVDSKLGQGTKITVYLPLTDKKPKELSGAVEDIESIRFDGYTALVADDETDLLGLIVGMLEDMGMNVLKATDGHEALALQDDFEGQVDLLLTDVVMPELNGVDLAELMQELRPEIKVIYMSGYPDKGSAASVDIPDDAFFIAKPIKHDDLIVMIYKVLNGDDADISAHIQSPRWAQSDKSDEA